MTPLVCGSGVTRARGTEKKQMSSSFLLAAAARAVLGDTSNKEILQFVLPVLYVTVMPLCCLLRVGLSMAADADERAAAGATQPDLETGLSAPDGLAGRRGSGLGARASRRVAAFSCRVGAVRGDVAW